VARKRYPPSMPLFTEVLGSMEFSPVQDLS
jgi:hypothetical protein